MSSTDLKAILIKAIHDSKFRALLFKDQPQAIAPFTLTSTEIIALNTIDEKAFIQVCEELEISIIREKLSTEDFPLLLV